MRKGLSYDDVLLEPRYSEVDSRSDVDLSTEILPGIELDIPIISAPMDSVTGPELAQELADCGGVGILHRFADWETRRQWIREIDGTVGASIGISEEDISIAVQFEEAGVDFICVDVAHGHLQKTLDFVEEIDSVLDVPLMVGNVATYAGAEELYYRGADCVKAGVGGGSLCTTREKTGIGVPQFTTVRSTEHTPPTIVADGGISKPGDAVKALMGGADAVMMGGELGKCLESPGDDVWGMASEKGKEQSGSEGYIEGERSSVSCGEISVKDVVGEYEDGIRSGLSYLGGHTIEEARENASFIEITSATERRNGSFIE